MMRMPAEYDDGRRNGTKTSYFNNADQVNGVTTPSPDGVLGGEVTTNFFDNMGRMTGSVLPDNTSVTNLYTSKGELQQTSGSRTYPVGYGYDAQGRMTTMTNWTNFAGLTGSRVTTWNYDTYRGFLTNKVYDEARWDQLILLRCRTACDPSLARGTNTTYSYNGAGDLATVIYNDGVTPGMTNGYDRLGQQTIITNGATVCTLAYNDAGQL